jgi:hypothetical protein|tara:strand:- start:268 stop:801 length:534 start_codon:yes stop_codon:yes gene_type:complete
MTSSNIQQIFSEAALAPTGEVIVEEVIASKEVSVDNLVYGMVELASYLYHLNTQANLLSLNLESPNSLEMSEFLKDQYKRHLCDFNSMAEKVRSMDYLLPMCEKGLMGAFKSFKNVKSYESRESLVTYVRNLEDCGFKAKELYDTAREVGAPDVEMAIAEIIGNLFGSAGKIKATLR